MTLKGGNWILGGKMTDNQTILNYGLKLTDACVNTYFSTAYVSLFLILLALLISCYLCTLKSARVLVLNPSLLLGLMEKGTLLNYLGNSPRINRHSMTCMGSTCSPRK